MFGCYGRGRSLGDICCNEAAKNIILYVKSLLSQPGHRLHAVSVPAATVRARPFGRRTIATQAVEEEEEAMLLNVFDTTMAQLKGVVFPILFT